MRILYVCTYYHRAMIFRDSMDYLEKRGHSVLAFNAVAKGTKIDGKYQSVMDEKVVHRECFNKYDRFLFRIKQSKIRKAIEANISVDEFDLIHCHTLFNGGWATYQLHKKYGVPYIVSVRNTDLNVFLKIPTFKRIAREIVNHAAGVLFLSEAYRDRFLKLCYPGDEKKDVLQKCDVIPNGLEPFWLENIGEVKESVHDPLALLCVGKIDRNKNMGTAIRVTERLNERGQTAHLTVIGQVVDDSVKMMLDDSRFVTTVPYLTKEELIRYYRSSDIFLMPSFRESFGRVYAEAMTQGLPVIFTRGQGFDGTFRDGEVGYSVKADDAEEIERAVGSILERYRAISQNCIDNCRIFNWNDISERLERFYRRAVAGDGK